MKEKSKVKNDVKDNLAAYYFHQGTNFYAYDYLGVHSEKKDGQFVYTFRTYAPAASEVYVCGDFNGWAGDRMTRVTDRGVWEVSIYTASPIEGDKYKFRIHSFGETHYKADPYAFYSETMEKTASVVHTSHDYAWQDAEWMRKRPEAFSGDSYYSAPMNIYEMHLGSWKRHLDGSFLNYREIADELVPYIRQMSYTHVELLPVAEHPLDASWGYQVCGYYAPTSRFGTPEDFKYFIDLLHKNNIGVIIDWVPAHFPKDEHGLARFDGTYLYEYQGDDRRENRGWGTYCFDVGREEVQSFLVSNALFWFREYHIDGLRVDAVASMLYLDYDREPGSWIPNVNGDNKNLESIAFFKKLNTAVFDEFSDVMMIAEESTAWPMITKPVSAGGLGFNFKWNMGWANDMFEYVALDPIYRKYHHNKINFSLTYAFSENYILTVSHDEVVHGKRSLLDKMFGTYEQKFAGMRTFLAYMMAHPGKKLLFMGSEYGQFREWDFASSLEWFMRDYEMHGKLHHFVAELNRMYVSDSRFWERDFSWEGFEWIYPDLADLNIAAFRRINHAGEKMDAIFNFAPVARPDFEVTAEEEGGEMRVIMSTDDVRYGGSGMLSTASPTLHVENGKYHIPLPPLSAIYLESVPDVRRMAEKNKKSNSVYGG